MIQFDTNSKIPVKKYPYILNKFIPKDIYIYDSYLSNTSYHVRYDVFCKKYVYKIDLNKKKDLIMSPYMYHYPYFLDIKNMIYSIKYIKGEHNFKGFCTNNKDFNNNFTRKIFNCELFKNDKNILEFHIIANGFLYNMIRIIVGTLLDIGRKKTNKNIFNYAIKEKNKKILNKIAPSYGLTLTNIFYKNRGEFKYEI